MKKKKRRKPARRKPRGLSIIRSGKPARRKAKWAAIIRSGITLVNELGSIASFLIAVYYLIKEFI